MKIAIIGGGLVGALSAIIFGQNGHLVQIYELRSDPRCKSIVNRGRSINLALSTRGRTALAMAGLEETVLEHAVPMKGRMVHLKNGKRKKYIYDSDGNESIWSVNRNFLNILLLQEAEKIPNVTVHFNCKLTSINLETGVFTLRSLKDELSYTDYELEADLILGADGAHSTIRSFLINKPLVNFSQAYIEHGYMELHIPSDDYGKHLVSPNYLHVWPRNHFMLIALPNNDGTFTATLFMPFEKFGMLRDKSKLVEFFSNELPEPMNMIGINRICEDFGHSKPSPLISVECSPLNYGKIVLIGDAAHAMVPFYGQGMNAGFEDILIVNELLTPIKHTQPVMEEIQFYMDQYSSKRTSDAKAICEMAMYNYYEMRVLTNGPLFYWRATIDTILHKIFKEGWIPIYQNVVFSHTPYNHCLQHRKWQDTVLRKGIISLFFLLLCGLMFWSELVYL